MKISELEVDHDYYCDSQMTEEFDTWKDFLTENADMPINMNLLFRFDVHFKKDLSDDFEDGYLLDLFFIAQRKGYLFKIRIESVTDDDADSINNWLLPRFRHLTKLWEPLK